MNKDIRLAIIASGSSDAGDSRALMALDFDARLDTTIVPNRGILNSFSRASAATVTDFEGLVKLCRAEEARFYGARRVENLLDSSSLSIFNSGTGVATNNGDGSFTFSCDIGDRAFINSIITSDLIEGHQYLITFDQEIVSGGFNVFNINLVGATVAGKAKMNSTNRGTSGLITASGATQTLRLGLGIDNIMHTACTVIISNIQLEDVTGQTNQNPSEYVSVGAGTEVDLIEDYDFSLTATGATPDDVSSLAALVTAEVNSNDQLECKRNGSAETIYHINLKERTDFRLGSLIQIDVDVAAIIVGNCQLWMGGNSITGDLVNGKNRLTHRITTLTNDALTIRLADSTTARTTFNSISVKEIQHGTNGDGVKYFPYENGNTVSSNVVSEARGVSLTTLKGCLLEESSTNLIEESEDLSSASVWGASPNFRVTRAVNSGGISVLGRAFYDLLETTDNNTHHLNHSSITVVSAETCTMYVYARKLGRSRFAISNTNPGSYVVYDFDTETVIAESSASGRIVDTGYDGWFYCEFTYTTNNTSTIPQIYTMRDTDTTPLITTYVGDVTKGVSITGIQFTRTATPTSYIPTAGSTVARSADILLYDYQPNALEGSMVCTVNNHYQSTTNNTWLLANNGGSEWIHNVSAGNRIYASDGTGNYPYKAVTAEILSITYGLTWEDGAAIELHMYDTGTLYGTSGMDADGFVAGSDPLGVGCRGVNGVGQHSGCYKDIMFFNATLTQPQMEIKTS